MQSTYSEVLPRVFPDKIGANFRKHCIGKCVIVLLGTTGDSFIRVEKRIEPAKITIFNLSYLSFYFMYLIAIKSIKKISYLFSLSIIFINIAHL